MPSLSTDQRNGLANAIAARLNTVTGGTYSNLTPSMFTAFAGWWVNDATVLALEGMSAHISAFDGWIDDQGSAIQNCIDNNNTIADASMCVVVHYEMS